MAGADILSSILNMCVPIGSQMLNNHLAKEHAKRMREISMDELNKREKIISKRSHSSPEEHQIHINDEIPEVPEFEFKAGEGIDEIGKRMWNTYHDLSLQLPDNATTSQVRVFLRKVERSMRNHPCEECRNNITKHLSKIKMIGHTKTDAVKKIFEIHNKVNKELGKPVFSTEQFKKTYHYPLE